MTEDIHKTRRRFLTSSGAAAAGAAMLGGASLAAPAIAQDRRQLTMVSAWPKGTPGVGVNAERFAQRLERLSGGRISVAFYAAGELVPPFEVLDAVSGGTADLGHASPYYWAGNAQALHFFSTIPFGLTAMELVAWITFGGGQELWDEIYAPLGVKPFYAGSSGTQFGGWFNREINSLDDLSGLRFRVAGLGGEVMRRLGVTPVLTPPGEIHLALSSGTVDAVEWIGPWNDVAFGLDQRAQYYYTPGVLEPGPGLEVIVNLDLWNDLPEDLQEAVRSAADATAQETTADFLYHNTESLRGLLDAGEVEMRTFPDEVMQAMAQEITGILDDFAAQDESFARVRASYDTFLRDSQAYAPYAEQGLLTARSRFLSI